MPELVLPTKTKKLEEKLGPMALNELFDLVNLLSSQTKQEISDEQANEQENKELSFGQKLSKVELELINEINNTKVELKSEIESSISELKSELKVDNGKLRLEAAQNKTEIIKWMFIFWTGSVFIIIGSIIGFLSLLLK